MKPSEALEIAIDYISDSIETAEKSPCVCGDLIESVKHAESARDELCDMLAVARVREAHKEEAEDDSATTPEEEIKYIRNICKKRGICVTVENSGNGITIHNITDAHDRLEICKALTGAVETMTETTAKRAVKTEDIVVDLIDSLFENNDNMETLLKARDYISFSYDVTIGGNPALIIVSIDTAAPSFGKLGEDE